MLVKDKPFEWRCLAEWKNSKMCFLISAVYFHYLPNSQMETTLVQWRNQQLCNQQLLQSQRFRKPIQKNRCDMQLKFSDCSSLEEFSISSPFMSCFLEDVLNKDYFGYYILGHTSLSRKLILVELFTGSKYEQNTSRFFFLFNYKDYIRLLPRHHSVRAGRSFFQVKKKGHFVLPNIMFPRHYCSEMTTQDALCTCDLDHSETYYSTAEFSMRGNWN